MKLLLKNKFNDAFGKYIILPLIEFTSINKI